MEEDKRFSHIATDPKFRHIPKAVRKVKIDNRFQSMFKDKKFQSKYTVDKRGRPINQTSKEDLKRYYELSSDDSDEDEAESDQEVQSDEHVHSDEDGESSGGKFVKPLPNDKEAPTEDNTELNIKHKTDKQVSEAVKKKLKNLSVNYARGEAALFSESSSDDEESEEEANGSDGDTIEHEWGEFDADAECTEKATRRLAACNMDWDRIRAVDLMVLLNSFKPTGGVVESVVIYPSEFGKQRLQEEEVKGPIELIESSCSKEDEDDNEEGSAYHMEKLRKYQLNRLKYYYAVISFDSPETANKVYTECDGMEYESSATKLDLRFIPDDMIFEDEPKEVCDKLPDATKYQPRFFTTTALQQAKVDLTWDETSADRMEFTKKVQGGNLDKLTDEDLQTYLGYSSGEENDEEEESKVETSKNDEESSDPISKYRALLNEIEEKERERQEKDIQMEVTWDIDLKEKREKLVQQRLAEKEEKTPFEKYLDKRKAKRKEKREKRKTGGEDSEEDVDSDIPEGIDMSDPYFAEEFNNPEFKKKQKPKKSTNEDDEEQNNGDLELLLMNEEEDNKKHFSLKKIQEQDSNTKKSKKYKKKNVTETKKDDFAINVDDDRFSALYTSHHYNIDPTNPHFKKTKNMEMLISEKIKRRNTESYSETTNPEKKVKTSDKKNPELNVLVKSIKQKTLNYSNKNKRF